MTPVTYRVRSQYVAVMSGSIMLGRIVYRSAFDGWCWAPLNSTHRTPARPTWPDVKPDVEAWLKENHP
jgi:hypothetical protein